MSKEFLKIQLFVTFAGLSIQSAKRYRNTGNKFKKYVMGEKRRHSASKLYIYILYFKGGPGLQTQPCEGHTL